MASVNKVIVLGNVGKDPEVRYLPNGDAACTLSIATSRKWKDKTSGEAQEETEWHRVSFFGRLSEIVGEYVTKGSPLYVEGRLKTRKYADKDGVEKFITEIIASELQLLGGREQSGGGQGGAAPQQGRAPAPQGRAPAPTQQRAPQSRGGSDNAFSDMDDDIPF